MSEKSTWFALYAIDSKIDDETRCNSNLRGEFRLHPKGESGISKGCITVASTPEYLLPRDALRANGLHRVDSLDLSAYGIVTVL